LLGLFAPVSATILCALFTASLWAEGTGRFSLLRWVLPKQASYNLVVRAAADPALGTVVLAAPLDIPRWRPDTPKWFRRPMQAVLGAASVVTVLLALRVLAQPWGRPSVGMYAAALGVLALSVAAGIVAHRRSGGVHDDASGPAALIELIRRFQQAPVRGVDLWFAFTGCGHAYQNGMHAFLAMRGNRMTSPILVIALDEPGRPPLGAVVAEGPLFGRPHRSTGPALVERLRWAGLRIPSVDHAGVTDARAALLWGYRALALSGGSAPPSPELAVKAVDVTEALVRLYAFDVARVPDFAPMVRELSVDRVPETDAGEKKALGRLLARLRARVRPDAANQPEDLS
jgi:hypothetical protein